MATKFLVEKIIDDFGGKAPEAIFDSNEDAKEYIANKLREDFISRSVCAECEENRFKLPNGKRPLCFIEDEWDENECDNVRDYQEYVANYYIVTGVQYNGK